jgi:hypothetical protein
MVGVFNIAWAVVETLYTCKTKGTELSFALMEGLVMATIPFVIWLLPSLVRFSWMSEIMRSDGPESVR